MLTVATTMQGYFREALDAAMRNRRVGLTEAAQVYLVQLLSEFSRSENAFAGVDAGEAPTLATLLTRAKDSAPDEAVRLYKHLGDSSLYMSGFFSPAVDQKAVGRGYYVAMGESAYGSVASSLRSSAAMSSVLFSELADQFAALVDLLEAMSLHGEKTAPETLSDSKILALIDRYKKTGSRDALEALQARGVVLRPGLDGGSDVVN